MMLLRARVDFVTQDALAHAVDEHNAPKFSRFAMSIVRSKCSI